MENIKRIVFAVIATICFTMTAWGQDPYTVLSDDDTVLTFYYDNNLVSRGGRPLRPYLMPQERPWHHAARSITKVVFDDSFGRYQTLIHTAYWFCLCSNLREIVGMKNLKTYEVVYMHAMFDHCSSLTSIDLSQFSTSNVRSMLNIFYGCTSLTSLDLSRFSTLKLEDTRGMFYGCTSLTTLDLSSFKTDKLENISTMFKNCTSLKTIYVGKNWNLTKVKYDVEVFQNCPKLVGGMGTTYNAAHTDHSYAHADGGRSNPGYFTHR